MRLFVSYLHKRESERVYQSNFRSAGLPGTYFCFPQHKENRDTNRITFLDKKTFLLVPSCFWQEFKNIPFHCTLFSATSPCFLYFMMHSQALRSNSNSTKLEGKILLYVNLGLVQTLSRSGVGGACHICNNGCGGARTVFYFFAFPPTNTK